MKSKIYKICPECGTKVTRTKDGIFIIVDCLKCDWSQTVRAKQKVKWIKGLDEGG